MSIIAEAYSKATFYGSRIVGYVGSMDVANKVNGLGVRKAVHFRANGSETERLCCKSRSSMAGKRRQGQNQCHGLKSSMPDCWLKFLKS